MGTFYWQARGKWAAQLTMRDGKRSTATCSHDHPTRGRGPCQESRDLLADLDRLRSQHAPANARTLTLGAFLNGWLDDVKPDLAPATWRKYESISRTHILPVLGSRRLSDLSPVDVRRFLQQAQPSRVRRVDDPERMAVLDGQTRRHLRGTLRRILGDAQRHGLVSRNVAALTVSPKLDQRERTILTAAQCRTLIEGTEGDRMHAFYVLAVTTGMREAEMLGLTWEDIDLGDVRAGVDGPRVAPDDQGRRRGQGGLLDVRIDAARSPSVAVRHTLQRVEGQWQLRPPKTDKSRRTIPLTPVAVAALIAHRQRQMAEGGPGDGLVFTTPRGLPVHGSNLLPPFRAHLARLGLPKVGIHDLRHSAATMMYAMGVPLPVISDILGHSTIRVTSDLYRHRVPELAEDAARRIEEALG